MTSTATPPLLPSLHVLSASTLDTEMKRDRDDYESAAEASPELVAAVKAFVLAARAHIEASMGNNRQVAPFFYDPSQRGGEDPRVTATRADLKDTYLQFQNVWMQNTVAWSASEADRDAGMRDAQSQTAPELCLLYAVHFANVRGTPSGAGVQSVADSMLRSIAGTRGYTPMLAGVLCLVRPVGTRSEDVGLALQLGEIAYKIRQTRARVVQELPPSSVATADVVRDLTLPPAVEYWYERLRNE